MRLAVMPRLREPKSWLLLALVAAALGLTLGGGWVSASALFSLLVVLAPCLLMCALGLCMRHGVGEGCQRHADAAKDTASSTLTTKAL